MPGLRAYGLGAMPPGLRITVGLRRTRGISARRLRGAGECIVKHDNLNSCGEVNTTRLSTRVRYSGELVGCFCSDNACSKARTVTVSRSFEPSLIPPT